jgi:hypothetical protein
MTSVEMRIVELFAYYVITSMGKSILKPEAKMSRNASIPTIACVRLGSGSFVLNALVIP